MSGVCDGPPLTPASEYGDGILRASSLATLPLFVSSTFDEETPVGWLPAREFKASCTADRGCVALAPLP